MRSTLLLLCLGVLSGGCGAATSSDRDGSSSDRRPTIAPSEPSAVLFDDASDVAVGGGSIAAVDGRVFFPRGKAVYEIPNDRVSTLDSLTKRWEGMGPWRLSSVSREIHFVDGASIADGLQMLALPLDGTARTVYRPTSFGAVWLADDKAVYIDCKTRSCISRIEEGSGQTIDAWATFPSAGESAAAAQTDDALWVLVRQDLLRVDKGTGNVTTIGTVADAAYGAEIVGGGASVWVAGAHDLYRAAGGAALTRVGPIERPVVSAADEGHFYYVDHGAKLVTVDSGGATANLATVTGTDEIVGLAVDRDYVYALEVAVDTRCPAPKACFTTYHHQRILRLKRQ